MKLSKEEILHHLEEVTSSKTFSRSNVNVTLLRYLVNATLDLKDLKESLIGQELFGKNYDPFKNDNKVRVYIHNLRKKLEEFYSKEKPKTKLRFEISKGQYRVSFLHNYSKKRNRFSYLGLSIIAITIILLQYFLSSKNDKIPFWNNFLSGNNSNTVLVGDHFTIVGELPTGGHGVIRDYSINSESELSERLMNNSNLSKQLKPNDFSYITKMGTYSIHMLSSFFTKNNATYNLMLNSEWDKSQLGKENILFVGQYKTMSFLKNIFNENNPNFSLQLSSVNYQKDDEGINETYIAQADSLVVDYTIVSKMAGQKETEIIMFISDHDIGVIQMIDYFTNLDSLNSFYNMNQIENEFTALFRVSGWERVGYKMELIQLDK